MVRPRLITAAFPLHERGHRSGSDLACASSNPGGLAEPAGSHRMPVTSPSLLRLADCRRAFYWLGEVRVLRNRPRVQRQRIHEGLADLAPHLVTPPVGRRVSVRTWCERLQMAIDRQVTIRSLRWLAAYLAQDVWCGDGSNAEHGHDPDTTPDPFTLHLFIVELYRLHRQGALEPEHEPEPLTDRQQQMLDRVLAGEMPHEIGIALRLSRRTVEEHMSILYQKFGVANRAQLMAKFIAQ